MNVFVKASRKMESEQPWSDCPNCVKEERRSNCCRWEKHGMSNCQQLIPATAIHGKLTSSQTESITRLSCLIAIIDSLIKSRKSTDINHEVGTFTKTMLDVPSIFVCAATAIALQLWVCNNKSSSLSTGIQWLGLLGALLELWYSRIGSWCQGGCCVGWHRQLGGSDAAVYGFHFVASSDTNPQWENQSYVCNNYTENETKKLRRGGRVIEADTDSVTFLAAGVL